MMAAAMVGEWEARRRLYCASAWSCLQWWWVQGQGLEVGCWCEGVGILSLIG